MTIIEQIQVYLFVFSLYMFIFIYLYIQFNSTIQLYSMSSQPPKALTLLMARHRNVVGFGVFADTCARLPHWVVEWLNWIESKLTPRWIESKLYLYVDSSGISNGANEIDSKMIQNEPVELNRSWRAIVKWPRRLAGGRCVGYTYFVRCSLGTPQTINIVVLNKWAHICIYIYIYK